MDRAALQDLLAWKVSPRRKPLILKGVRQSGKTWLLEHFGTAHYRDVAYFNFEEQPDLKQFFEIDKTPAASRLERWISSPFIRSASPSSFGESVRGNWPISPSPSIG